MLLFKDNRLSGYGVSFAIPDNFRFECNPEVLQNGILVEALDGSYRIEYQIFVNRYKDIMDNIRTTRSAPEYKPLSDLTPITIGGLSGYQHTYIMERNGNYDICLLLNNQPGHYCILDVSVWSETGRDIEEIKLLPEVKAALAAIQKEDYIEHDDLRSLPYGV